jgi:HAD superfamily, subfamily IIIB (Acid phosphatase)
MLTSSKTALKRYLLALFFLKMRHRAALATLLALVFFRFAQASDPNCMPASSLPPAEVGQPPNIDGLKAQLRYYKCSGAYERDFSEVVDQAISYVVKRADEIAKGSQGVKPAIVLDIDETSLSNWAELQADDFGFILNGSCTLLRDDPCGDDAWELRSEGTALPTIRLFNKARELNVAIFFISGRGEEKRKATELNLSKATYSGWTQLMLRPNKEGTVEQFKTAMRQKIEEMMHYKIIANVGDQYSDLRGGHAEQVFKVPNPFYFIP